MGNTLQDNMQNKYTWRETDKQYYCRVRVTIESISN